MQRVQILVKGIVQGVGFRPFVYRLANDHKLCGFVLNNGKGVIIEVEGEEYNINKFISELKFYAPPLSRIEEIQVKLAYPSGDRKFFIKDSVFDTSKDVLISPDIATCDECVTELFNPVDRHFLYPFTNCTNCGPRFTIIKNIPYDRANTTMQKFLMCPECKAEYESPLNRRFHAQPNACHKCGPEVELVRNGVTIAYGNDSIKMAIKLLKEGNIVAIKGVGGFHLACDALNERAVNILRKSKSRDTKPFALMAKELKIIKKYCYVSYEEEKVLTSPRRPITLLRKKIDIPWVAPYNKYLGFMLPYTPLHYLLFNSHYASSVLVMTSGNFSDEPICYENEEAMTRLKKIAEYFLIHNRPIHIRCDDSILRVFEDKEIIIRRSRGYVPEPIELPINSDYHILACGAELKNIFCLTKASYAFLSHHIGDLENLEALFAFEDGIEHFKHIFSINPTIIAHDLHPEYLSTKYAKKFKTFKLLGIQHHHAHIVACMVDNRIKEKVIGVAFDGLGYGLDRNLWGGEFLIVDYSQFKRMAHLQYIPMPGGTQAIKEPWRMCFSWLYNIYGDELFNLNIEFTKNLDREKCNILKNLIVNHINSPITSSIGRLFDAISSLLGVCKIASYEGEAAIRLEAIADEASLAPYNYELSSTIPNMIINPKLIFIEIIKDLIDCVPIETISGRFHATIANMIVSVCDKIHTFSNINKVALSGGVFQNMVLLAQAVNLLRNKGFEVYIPHRIPVNDGCISLGQAVIASYVLRNSC